MTFSSLTSLIRLGNSWAVVLLFVGVYVPVSQYCLQEEELVYITEGRQQIYQSDLGNTFLNPLRFQQLERRFLAVVASQVTCTLTWLLYMSVLGVWKAEMAQLLRFPFLPCPMMVSYFVFFFF